MATTEQAGVSDSLLGRFWLASAPERVVRGELALEVDGPRLELAERLTSFWRATTSSPGVVELTPGPSDRLHTVHGELDDGRPVTLVETRGGTLPPLGHRDAGGQVVPAGQAVLGDHVAGPEQGYVRVRVRLRHLEEWARVRALPKPVQLEGGEWLDVERAAQGAHWLRVVGLPASTQRDVGRRLLTPLTSLVTLAADVDCPPVAVELATGADTSWLPLHASWLRTPAERPRPADRMLVRLAELGLDGVREWLSRVEKLTPLPPVVAAAAAGEPRTLEAGVLALTTVAEGLARRLWPDWERLTGDEAAAARSDAVAALAGHGEHVVEAVRGALGHVHEPSYPQRLRRLTNLAEVAVPGVTGSKPSRWRNEVVESRIDFAHQRTRGFLDEDRVDRYYNVRESVRWLLTGVLLLETGLPAETLAERFRHHQRYQEFLRQARGSLPRVYGPA